jgi:Sec-independent protein secretion pathway component TatC
MSPPDHKPDELEGTEQPFVSHLIELRDRLIRAVAAIAVCFGVLAIYPGPSELYDLLAHPLVASMPAGGKLIATNVISPFLVPMKITLMAAFLLALPIVLYQVWAFVAPGLYSHEKKLVLPWWSPAPCCSSWAWRSATSSSSARCSHSSRALRPRASPRSRTSRPT